MQNTSLLIGYLLIEFMLASSFALHVHLRQMLEYVEIAMLLYVTLLCADHLFGLLFKFHFVLLLAFKRFLLLFLFNLFLLLLLFILLRRCEVFILALIHLFFAFLIFFLHFLNWQFISANKIYLNYNSDLFANAF